jgi:hypothetical protein
VSRPRVQTVLVGVLWWYACECGHRTGLERFHAMRRDRRWHAIEHEKKARR